MKATLALGLGLLLLGCKEEKRPPEAADAGAQVHRLADEGVSILLPIGWLSQPETKGPSVTRRGDQVRTVGRARRVPSGRPFVVPPKVVITVEPTSRVDPDEVFRTTMEDLRRLGESPGVTIQRSALSTRFLGTTRAGEIELSYQIRAGKAPPQDVVHRSTVILRRPKEGSRVIVTVTATYLAADEQLVSTEVQSIMNSLKIEE